MSRKSVSTKYEDEWIYVLVIYFPTALIFLIAIFVADKDARPILQPVLIGVAILITLIAGMVTYIMLAGRNRKRREFQRRINEIEEGEENESISELTEDVLEQPTISERSSRRVVKKKKKLVLNYRKKKLVYKGDVTGKNCPICKLQLRKDQELLACPQCKTPFHEDHLIQWMGSKNSCPVCGEAYAIIDREKEIRDKEEKN